MTRKERWELAAVVGGGVFGLPLGMLSSDITDPLLAGVPILHVYLGRVAAFAIVFALLLIHRFFFYRR